MIFEKKILVVAVATSLAVLAGCSSDDSTDNTDTISEQASYTLTNDNVYMLASGFPGTIIGDGHNVDGSATNDDNITLNIEAGTLVLGSAKEALIVTRGSKIEAVGTAADPIVMTSKTQFDAWVAGGDGTSGRGEWAGLALMGYGKSNECATPCDVEAEGGIGAYGGTDDTDNSGTLQYVVVRHAGNEITTDNELNGLTLFATGSGTTMDHIQVHKGLDDGIEHFGGADFMSHLVLTDNADDSFDWGQGYTGGVQYMVVKQANDDGDRAIEADNDKGDPNAGPISLPTLANMTLIAADASTETSADGILLRRGTGANIYNSIITGFADACIDIDETATMDRAHSGTAYTGDLTIDNTFVDCATNFEMADQDLDKDVNTGVQKDTDGDGTMDEGRDTFAEVGKKMVSEWFAESGTGNDSTTTVDLTSSGLPTGGFDATVTAPSIGNSKFVNTTYAGAFDPAAGSQWSEGWTVGLHGNTTVWEPATGVSPTSTGTCPTGTTFVEAITLPNGAGQMDLCQLKASY